jgi:general secretion pathway protein K
MTASPPARESGVALLVVLLAITLLTVVVVEFTDSSQVETHLALGGRNALQAYYLARSGVNAAEDILMLDAMTDQGKHVDSDDDFWARPLPPWPIGDGTVVLQITDEARRLDVNALSEGENRLARKVFRNLFGNLRLDQALLSAVIDWLDADDNPGHPDREHLAPWPLGAEWPFYRGQTPPVRPPNGPVHSVRDLLGVRGMTPEKLAQLEPFVTALPVESGSTLRVNINTAPAQVLLALDPELTEAVVRQLIEARSQQRFTNADDVPMAVRGFAGAIWNRISSHVRVDSDYFRIQTVGTVGGIARGLTVVVKRDGSRITRVRWTPNTVPATLTSQRPSDLVEALPPLGGR